MNYVNIDTFYDKYIDRKQISKKDYKIIVLLFIQFMIDEIIKGEEVILPFKLGTFRIVGRQIKPKITEEGKIKGLSPNWNRTMKLWKEDEFAKKEKRIVYNFNEHTSGIIYKFIHSKKGTSLTNRGYYTFRLSRANKRKVHDAIISGKEYLIK